MAEPNHSSFYVTGGTLRQDAACCVERQADKDLLEGLLHSQEMEPQRVRQDLS